MNVFLSSFAFLFALQVSAWNAAPLEPVSDPIDYKARERLNKIRQITGHTSDNYKIGKEMEALEASKVVQNQIVHRKLQIKAQQARARARAQARNAGRP